MTLRDLTLIPLAPVILIVALAGWIIYGPIGNWVCGGKG
jgi:hypothetical protein